MTNGSLLLELLGSGEFGRWLVVHGHKHHPKLTYASGGAASAVIFSAGSLSVDIQHELQGHSRNQFYLIDLPLNEIAKGRFVGRIEAWDWTNGRGWIPAGPSSGLPSSGIWLPNRSQCARVASGHPVGSAPQSGRKK